MYEITHNGETSTLKDDWRIITIIGDYICCESTRGDTQLYYKIAEVLKFIDDHKKQKPAILECEVCGAKKRIVGEKPTAYMCDSCLW